MHITCSRHFYWYYTFSIFPNKSLTTRQKKNQLVKCWFLKKFRKTPVYFNVYVRTCSIVTKWDASILWVFLVRIFPMRENVDQNHSERAVCLSNNYLNNYFSCSVFIGWFCWRGIYIEYANRGLLSWCLLVQSQLSKYISHVTRFRIFLWCFHSRET